MFQFLLSTQELKKFLKNKMNLNPVKIKAMPDKRVFGNHAFVCFRSEEERTEAMAKLDGYMWKGKAIKATVYNITDQIQSVLSILFLRDYSLPKL